MEKSKNPGNPVCYTPSSEPFRIYVSLYVCVVLCAVFLWVWCVICVLCLIVVHCHRVKTQLQFKKITIIIINNYGLKIYRITRVLKWSLNCSFFLFLILFKDSLFILLNKEVIILKAECERIRNTAVTTYCVRPSNWTPKLRYLISLADVPTGGIRITC
jgi:hypothetical protein